MKKLKTALLLVLVVAVLTGCTTFNNFKEAFFSDGGNNSDTIKIGVLEPQTGNDSQKGEMEIRGIQLANELVPEVLGKKIELVYADTQSSIYVAESAVSDLIDKAPAVVLGSYGDAVTLAASKPLEEAEIPAITITATNPLITDNNDFYFRVTFSDASQGRAIADYVYSGLGLSKAGVVRMKDDDAVTEMVSQFTNRMERLTKDADSVNTIVDISADASDVDYKEYLQEIKDSKIRVVFMAVSLKTAENIFAQAQKMNMTDVTFIGPKDWHNQDLVELQAKFPGIKIAAASEFASTTTSEAETTDLYEQFLSAYEKKYGGDDPEEAAALAFDAYMIAVSAIEKAGSTEGQAVKEALKATSNFAGVSGEISFNDNGEPTKTINIDVIQNGKFVSVYTVN